MIDSKVNARDEKNYRTKAHRLEAISDFMDRYVSLLRTLVAEFENFYDFGCIKASHCEAFLLNFIYFLTAYKWLL